MNRCYVCGSTNIDSRTDNEGFLHLTCRNCHMMRIHPSHFISGRSVYTDAYFNGSLCRETNGKLGYTESYVDLTTSHRAYHYKKYIDKIMNLSFEYCSGNIKVLDFGCGYGTFLKVLKNRMADMMEMHGIDLDAEVCAKASLNLVNAHIYCADIKTDAVTIPRNYFDLITLLDVLEHLDDPLLYLQRLSEIAKKNGYLLISTPNIESFNAKFYRDHWVLYSPPYHANYFGPHSIKLLLHQCGWETIELYTERTIFHNERYISETWRGKLIKALFQNWFWDMLTNKLFHIGSIMVVMARKI